MEGTTLFCYLFCKQGRRRCCCCCSTLPVGCRVDPVWVTLIKTALHRKGELMENVTRCHLCVTRWICRAMKAVQFFWAHLQDTCRYPCTRTDFLSLLLLCSAVSALLEGPDTFFCLPVAAVLWLQQETHLLPETLSGISNSCQSINTQIITNEEFDRTEA